MSHALLTIAALLMPQVPAARDTDDVAYAYGRAAIVIEATLDSVARDTSSIDGIPIFVYHFVPHTLKVWKGRPPARLRIPGMPTPGCMDCPPDVTPFPASTRFMLYLHPPDSTGTALVVRLVGDPVTSEDRRRLARLRH